MTLLSAFSVALLFQFLPSPEGGATGVDLRTEFAQDVFEEQPGVFLAVNSMPVGLPQIPEKRWSEARVLMRPLVLDTGGIEAGLFHLSLETWEGTPDVIQIFTPEGRRIYLPQRFPFDQVPPRLLVSGRTPGKVMLKLRYDGPPGAVPGGAATADRIVWRVAARPRLAGHTLAQFPWFEFPKDINENETLEVALDPSRHAECVGLPYEIHVVAYKSPAQWAADPALEDVTAAVESVTLLGTNIQDNTHLVWAEGLFGGEGFELGLGYQVVCDFGRDGQLDPGDLIDEYRFREAGFYVVKSLVQPGPLGFQSFEFDDSGLFRTRGFDDGSTRNMRSRGLVIYPDPMPEGKLPLVTFSHGNTGIRTSYRGYRYLQEHLASYGFITASFDMFPAHVSLGIRWRGWLTNKNTERLILQTQLVDHNGDPYPPMGGGVIDDKVDGDRIITSGHSRGGEGVIIQYNQVAHPEIPGIRPPGGTLQGFDADSFLGINAIAEVTFLTAAQGSKTDDRNFLLYFGGADNDVCGCSSGVLPTVHYNRAFGNKAMIYMYGAGHGFFNEQWPCTCTGPLRMNRGQVERVSKSYLLAFALMVTHDDPAAKEFFTRSPDRFRPLGTQGIAPERRIVNLYRDATSAGNFVIDDYEANNSDFLSSSGQPVSFNVNNFLETFFLDTNPTGGWNNNQPDGGFWWETRGCIFDWNGQAFEYVQAIAPAEQDLSDDAFLSFITCQQADHPETVAEHGPRSVTVSLVDVHGTKVGINTLPYGDIDEPHLRSGGWGSAFKTYRLRIADFETNGTGLDLHHIKELRVEVGSDFGSVRGRLGFDDFEIVRK